MVHVLLAQYGLDELSIEEMVALMNALIEQIQTDVQEVEEAIIEDLTNEKESKVNQG